MNDVEVEAQDAGQVLEGRRRRASCRVASSHLRGLPKSWQPASLIVCPLKRSLYHRAALERWGCGPLLDFWRLVGAELLLAHGGAIKEICVTQEVMEAGAGPGGGAGGSPWQTVSVRARLEVGSLSLPTAAAVPCSASVLCLLIA